MYSKRTRKGRSLITTITTDMHESMFHEIDNLNTKTIDEAQDNYERVFVTVREALSKNEQYCCDDENDRLSLAQVVTDLLRQGGLIRKEPK